MPQGRRKVPFSTKQKKEQLRKKKDKKRLDDDPSSDGEGGGNKQAAASGVGGADSSEPGSSTENRRTFNWNVLKVNQQPGGTSKDANRYWLHFIKESKQEIERRKDEAKNKIVPVSADELEIDPATVFLPGSELDIPKRPKWDYAMSKMQLEARENKYFREYLENIEHRFGLEGLSYFELNLETWRQLWRVLEMSDVLLLITDARFPALLFSPALYDHVTRELGKEVVLVLNKIDLVSPEIVIAWKHYFLKRYPKVHVIYFTSFPGNSDKDKGKGIQKRRRRGRLRMAAEGAKRLLEVFENIVQGKVDLSSWREKIEEELDDDDDEDMPTPEIAVTMDPVDTSFHQHERFGDGILTIGCVGQPNVGKSSLMNAVMGKKVVSVSRTPGHTKHFQTIFLTPTVRLCDCPGLVFPSKVPRPLQILCGCYPIAQLREPYSAVGYLGERIPLPRVLNVRHPEQEGTVVDPSLEWSALDICEAWAVKRGFITAKAARPDMSRAANNILRMAVEGRICLCLPPPGFSQHQEEWRIHEEIEDVEALLKRKKQLEGVDSDEGGPGASTHFQTGSTSESDEESDVDGTKFGRRATTKNKFALLGESLD